MRIALISHTSLYWTELYARHFVSRGHYVRVISFSREVLDSIEVDYVGAGTPTRLKIAYLLRVPRVWSLLRSFAPDVVFAPYLSSNGLIAALCRPRSLAVSAHGSDVFGSPGGRPLHERMMRFACRRAAIVHAVSQPLADALIRYGVPGEKIECFPIGIDTDWFQLPAERELESRPPRVVCTRHHELVYRNDTLVEAVGRLRNDGLDVRATFLGGGRLLEERRAQIHALGLDRNVELRGPVPAAEVRRVLQGSDIYVSGSSRDGASSSLLEAMACGLFPVVSAIAANRQWIDDGETGLLFDPGDAAGLADALRRAIVDAGLRASARDRNRARVVRDGNLAVGMARMERLLVRAAAVSPPAEPRHPPSGSCNISDP
jgi:glycosyltransferase involved in cell wall biosynthesis